MSNEKKNNNDEIIFEISSKMGNIKNDSPEPQEILNQIKAQEEK